MQIYREWLGLSLFFLVTVTYAGMHVRSLHYTILLRWIRWIAIGVAFGSMLKLSIAPRSPYGLLVVTSCAFWFLFETFFTWRRVNRLRRVPMPFFPHFDELTAENIWPNSPSWRTSRDFLLKNGFHFEMLLKADFAGSLWLLCPVFCSEDRKTRMVVKFQASGGQTLHGVFTLYSITQKGQIILTENNPGVYGGYYPNHWNVLRRPLLQRLRPLLALHAHRVSGQPLRPLEISALEENNDLQRQLREENLSRSFVIPAEQSQNQLQLSLDACYRIWLEIWLLRYFGRTI